VPGNWGVNLMPGASITALRIGRRLSVSAALTPISMPAGAPLDELLPWSHIDTGVELSFLKRNSSVPAGEGDAKLPFRACAPAATSKAGCLQEQVSGDDCFEEGCFGQIKPG